MASPADCDASFFTELVLVRHGQTVWNASKIIQGHLESYLNDIGRQQATAVANRLAKEPKLVAIYSSDLKRAVETAQIIANYCNLPEVIKEPMLRERHLGDLQGLTLRVASEKKLSAYQQFLSSNRDMEIAGSGESLNQFHARCTSALEKIARNHKGERVIVVSHGGVLREIYSKAAPNQKMPGGMVSNSSINVIRISKNGKWAVKSWGDITHLQGVEVTHSAVP